MSTSAWTPVDETAAKWTPVDERALTPSPMPTVSSGAPKGFLDSVKQWSENVSNDIKYGTDVTGIGTVLKKMGAHGVYSGNSEALGDFMASLPLGLARMTKGAAEAPSAPWQGTKDVFGGGLQAATMPSMFIAPEGSEAAAKIASSPEWVNLVHRVMPSAMKEDAGTLFQSIAKDANKTPVSLDNAGDAALRLMDWQKKTQLGPTINKFLNRITNPKIGPLTYEEARDFYQLLGKMGFDETSKLAGPVKYDLQRMVMGLKTDVGNAAETVGRGADYYKAMGDWAKAERLQDFYNTAKAALSSTISKAAISGAGAGAAGAVGYKIYKEMNQ